MPIIPIRFVAVCECCGCRCQECSITEAQALAVAATCHGWQIDLDLPICPRCLETGAELPQTANDVAVCLTATSLNDLRLAASVQAAYSN